MNITLTGASGFIGRRLMRALLEDRHSLHVLSRHAGTNLPPGVRISRWDPMAEEPPAESLERAHAVIHLAGEPVAQRWNPEVKRRIRESRLKGTRHLVQALSIVSTRPSVLICASAVGFYGDRGDEILTEDSAPGKGFLPEVCAGWENEAGLAESLGMRVPKIRTGIVLGENGGALRKMLPPFKMFVGGTIGSGRQWMPWIHIDDLVGLIRHALQGEIGGPVNGTAPNPVTNAVFTQKLAAALKRPAILPAPSFAIRLALGEMSEIVLGSQRALPKAAEATGYRFQYPELSRALASLKL